MAYGRPMKGRTRRVPITVHASVGTLDIIDDYVESAKRNRSGNTPAVDFWNRRPACT